MITRRIFGGSVVASGLGLLFPAKTAIALAEEEDILRIVRVGSNECPATSSDIDNVMTQIKCGDFFKISGELPVEMFRINRSPKPGILHVSIGSENRPATKDDIIDIQKSLHEHFEDNNLTIVTHHNFEAKWVPTLEEQRLPFIVSNHYYNNPVGTKWVPRYC